MHRIVADRMLQASDLGRDRILLYFHVLTLYLCKVSVAWANSSHEILTDTNWMLRHINLLLKSTDIDRKALIDLSSIT